MTIFIWLFVLLHGFLKVQRTLAFFPRAAKHITNRPGRACGVEIASTARSLHSRHRRFR
jgi:hypothetical protein